MPLYTTADLDIAVHSLADDLSAWLACHACEKSAEGFPILTRDSHPLAVRAKELQHALREFAAELAGYRVYADGLDEEPTRHTKAREATAFTGSEPIDEVVRWYASLPPWSPTSTL